MRDYAKRDLFQKLKMKYKRRAVVETILYNVVEKLSELGYINDYDYTESYINRKKNLGRKRIEYELHLKGINSEIINKVYSELDLIDEKEEIRKMFHKVRNKEHEKRVAYFMRRGFKLGDILEVLKDLD
jgi:regulatory protein